jgi:hypothetical protein
MVVAVLAALAWVVIPESDDVSDEALALVGGLLIGGGVVVGLLLRRVSSGLRRKRDRSRPR